MKLIADLLFRIVGILIVVFSLWLIYKQGPRWATSLACIVIWVGIFNHQDCKKE